MVAGHSRDIENLFSAAYVRRDLNNGTVWGEELDGLGALGWCRDAHPPMLGQLTDRAEATMGSKCGQTHLAIGASDHGPGLIGMPMGSLVVRARGLTKAFDGREVVCGIDLDVPRGGCFGFLGPNGAGKTTILRMILGQCSITAGSLEVLGLPVISASREIRRRAGVVPQADNLDPDFSVAENLRVYARYFELGGATLESRITELLHFVELTNRADDNIRALSGGMKRRLAIARALVNDPELIVLDEPTTGLDPQARHVIWARLRNLKASGKTLLLTTHFMEEAERLCDDLVVIDHGHIVTRGAPRRLVREHVEPDVIEIHDSRAEVGNVFADLEDVRSEQVGETRYLYTRGAAPVVERLEKHPELTYLHRPANLEDVFLKLTGRDLRD